MGPDIARELTAFATAAGLGGVALADAGAKGA